MAEGVNMDGDGSITNGGGSGCIEGWDGITSAHGGGSGG
jgi:hypothetical protein